MLAAVLTSSSAHSLGLTLFCRRQRRPPDNGTASRCAQGRYAQTAPTMRGCGTTPARPNRVHHHDSASPTMTGKGVASRRRVEDPDAALAAKATGRPRSSAEPWIAEVRSGAALPIIPQPSRGRPPTAGPAASDHGIGRCAVLLRWCGSPASTDPATPRSSVSGRRNPPIARHRAIHPIAQRARTDAGAGASHSRTFSREELHR